jgi:hypothetical protein
MRERPVFIAGRLNTPGWARSVDRWTAWLLPEWPGCRHAC